MTEQDVSLKTLWLADANRLPVTSSTWPPELGISISTLLYAKKEMGIGSRLAGLPAQSGQHWFWTASARHGKRVPMLYGVHDRPEPAVTM